MTIDSNEMSDVSACDDTERRAFLKKGSSAVAAGMVAPGVFLSTTAAAKPADQAVSSKVRWGMLVETGKCDSCDACVDACDKENGLTDISDPDIGVRWIRKVKVKDRQSQRVTELPMLCQHCETAPCVDVCPTGASMRRADGIVMVNMHTCIGCRYCMMACPFKARSFVHETIHNQAAHAPMGKGCVTSCNFCVHKVDAGEGTTACTEACGKDGNGALTFGDLHDFESPISRRLREISSRQLRADLGLNQGVRYSNI